jgi:hypothetical protein
MHHGAGAPAAVDHSGVGVWLQNDASARVHLPFCVQDGGMKRIFLLLLLPLAGCGWPDPVIAAAAFSGSAGSVAAIHRTPLDAVYSLVTGKDCSMVRLDQGKTYCRPVEPPPEPPVFCTRSLGAVDCWQDPAALPNRPMGVADGPATLTPEQEANRVRRWP